MVFQTASGSVVTTALAPAPLARDWAASAAGRGAAAGSTTGVPEGRLSTHRFDEVAARHQLPEPPTARHEASVRGVSRMDQRPAASVRSDRYVFHEPPGGRRWTDTAAPVTGDPSEAR